VTPSYDDAIAVLVVDEPTARSRSTTT